MMTHPVVQCVTIFIEADRISNEVCLEELEMDVIAYCQSDEYGFGRVTQGGHEDAVRRKKGAEDGGGPLAPDLKQALPI